MILLCMLNPFLWPYVPLLLMMDAWCSDRGRVTVSPDSPFWRV
jgi:hypothetical protein